MAKTNTKVTPAATAEGETQQTTAAPVEQQQATDAATPPVDQQNPDPGEAGNNPVQQEPALSSEPQASQKPTHFEAVDSIFEPNAIEVVAKCESFRRAGRVFTREASTIRLAELTEAQFKLLYEEPMLAVQFAYLAEEN